MILTIRTDKPEAEIGLYDREGNELEYKKWLAHRELSVTIHVVIKELLDKEKSNWADISGVVFFEGPGSFTGLRIGAAVANTLASVDHISLVGARGEDWINKGIEKLKSGHSEIALPFYGSEPHTTNQKK